MPALKRPLDRWRFHLEQERRVRQLEDVANTALLRAGPDGRLMLTAYGRLFARDVRPALEAITQTREKDPDHAP